MYKEADYFISENEILKTDLFDIKELEKGFSVYETVKITEGIPLFIEDHLERLHYSAKLKNKKIPYSDSEIKDNVRKLIEINDIKEGRLKFLVQFHSSDSRLILFFLNPINVSKVDYEEGVKIGLHTAKRENPNAKIINYGLRMSVNKIISEKKVFEVLLYNTEGIISECSKSNIFFIKNGIIYTSYSENVLRGITRKYVYKICKDISVEIKECEINISDLNSFDSAFITGTSIGILPVRKIKDVFFSADNEIIKSISHRYNGIVREYLGVRG